MRPSLRQISPMILELFWNEAPNDGLLQVLLSWEREIIKNFGEEIISLRIAYQSISCLLKSPVSSSMMERWQVFLDSNIELTPLPDKIWEIPVCYDPLMGKNLVELTKSKSIDLEELIALHTNPTYRIHFFGFLPGFMYLNGLDSQLHFPRKRIPDRKIEPGSVAIGGSQTGIYPTESPGGWHVIGKTPIPLFDRYQTPPVFAKPGERIRFYPISKSEFDQFSKNPKQFNFND